MLGDVSEGGHLISHGVPHQSQNGEISPKAIVESSNIQLPMTQNHSNVCESDISEEVVVTIGQYPNSVKIEEVNDGNEGSENSSGHHYLSNNQHQNLLNVTSATLNSVENYPRSVHHHLSSTERNIGDAGVLYGMYN